MGRILILKLSWGPRLEEGEDPRELKRPGGEEVLEGVQGDGRE